MFLPQVWDDLDVEVRLLPSSLECLRLTNVTVLHSVQVHRYACCRRASSLEFKHLRDDEPAVSLPSPRDAKMSPFDILVATTLHYHPPSSVSLPLNRPGFPNLKLQ